MEKKKRNGKVDFLKFIFSIIIITYHFNNSVEYPNELFHKGYIGVEFFFITSGFLFAKSLSKFQYNNDSLMKDSMGFMKKKYLSLFPYHFFVCAATIIYSIINYRWAFGKAISKIFNAIPDILLLRMGGIGTLSLLGHEWYLSAMIIVMFILTPIIIKHRHVFIHYAAPIMVVAFVGYLAHNFSDINVVSDWNGLFFCGLLRAAAEISLGCICYAVYESKLLDKINKAVLLIAEVLIYLIVILYSTGYFSGLTDYTVMFLLAPAVTISFSQKASVGFLNNRFISFLGKLSYPIYLTQMVVRQFTKAISPQIGYFAHLGIYIAAVIAASLICMYVTDGFIRLAGILKSKAKQKNLQA